jgi:serine/threonine protein kinase/tetratricopeptide (TPR) repeat protein
MREFPALDVSRTESALYRRTAERTIRKMAGFDPIRWQAVSPYLDRALEMTREDLAGWLTTLRAELPAIASDLEKLLADREALGAASFLDDGVAVPMASGLESGRGRRLDALTPGTRLGTYEIVALLGAGGMGEVYRAKDLRLGRDIALKVLPARMSADAGRLARFEREARTVASLNHPNIVMLHSVEDDGDMRFLTMELVEGQSLDDALAPGGLPIPRVIELGIALADALAAAHEKGVVHRDLKPGNVMLTRDGRVKVLDFGLAKLASSDAVQEPSPTATVAPTISCEGSIMGTVPYMAPEQIRGEAVDARTDLFALGIVLYELTSGTRPFTGETHADIGHAILHDAPKRLSSLRSDLPQDLERIIGACLEKEPGKRAQTALDVSKTLRGLRKELERSDPARPLEPAAPKAGSIAVLPFVNRSASADDEYFSDGLADELLNVLAKIKGLRVTARTSSFNFKGKNASIAEIGRALHVATVLEGSVRKAGNRVRISVQLVSVSDSVQLWSETYDRILEDIFAVQDDIAKSVVRELRTTLLGEEASSNASGEARAEVAIAAKGRGTDPEAHRLYLLARYMNDRLTPEETARAIQYLHDALERDPGFAFAWAELSRAYSNQAINAWTPVAEGYERSRDAATRALALEPDLAEGHSAIGWIRMLYDWDWLGAEASFDRALQLAPGNALVLRRAGALAETLGRLEQAITLCRQAVEKDPLNSGSYTNLGGALMGSDRFVEAEQAYRRACDLAPLRGNTFSVLALALLAQGRGEEAVEAASREPHSAFRNHALAIVHHTLGHRVESDEVLRELFAKHGEDFAYQIAEVLAVRGEADMAFEWLERALGYRDSGLAQAKESRYLRSLHSDPRWGVFLGRMGF